jgi:F-type H+-transporting ATPase subunit delta
MHFQRIVRAFKSLVDQEKGVSFGKILSVQPLRPEQLKEFEEETGKLLKTRVSLENETDLSLIGGVKIFVAGKVFDASLRTRLENLGNAIK